MLRRAEVLADAMARASHAIMTDMAARVMRRSGSHTAEASHLKVYLDSKDLIGTVERGYPSAYEQLADALRGGGHELVLSFVTVMEISAPLVCGRVDTNVTGLLNRIERLPITYIAKIRTLELREAYDAFRAGRECAAIAPFVNRFDYTLEGSGPPPTHLYLRFGLAEAVFTLWQEQPDLFRGFADWGDPARARVAADRQLTNKPSLRQNFVRVIGRQAQTHQVAVHQDDLEAFAHWVYDVSTRCPAVRVIYEAQHLLIKNASDIPKDGDIGDFSHMAALPYVDLMTMDRRACTYARQAFRAAGLPYDSRILSDVGDLIRALG